MVVFKMAVGRVLVVWAIVFVYIAGISSAADVSSTTCASAGTECNAIDHAQCDTNLLKCKCDQGFRENTMTCAAIGLTDPCSADSNCTGVTNAVCVTGTCKCSDGYKANGAACDLVHGTACSKTGICEGLENSACLQSKCACAPGYVKSGNICSPIYGKSCTNDVGCAGLNNSTCTNGKCACAPGYEASNDICSPESGAVSMKSAVGLVFGSMILLQIQAL